MKMQTKRLANKFKTLRTKKGMSLGELERRTGISRRTISRIENSASDGHMSYAHNLAGMAIGLGTTLDTISSTPARAIGSLV